MSNKMKLKTKPLDAKGQARLMGRLKADPAMILREHTINGVEAVERYTSELMASGVTKNLPETFRITFSKHHPQEPSPGGCWVGRRALHTLRGGVQDATQSGYQPPAARKRGGMHALFVDFEGRK